MLRFALIAALCALAVPIQAADLHETQGRHGALRASPFRAREVHLRTVEPELRVRPLVQAEPMVAFGWGYRPFGVAPTLPYVFLAPTYYEVYWASLGLEPPPPGFQWVRYGTSLLLVDRHTGNVVDTRPDIVDGSIDR